MEEGEGGNKGTFFVEPGTPGYNYNEDWKKGLLTGPIWNAAEHFFSSDLKSFTINLAPPQEDILSVVRISARPSPLGATTPSAATVATLGSELV